MIFRFSEVDILPNGEYDYDNAKCIGTIRHKDYVEYAKLLHYMKDMDYSLRSFGNLSLVKEIEDIDGNVNKVLDDTPYSIVDISLRIPFDNINLECMEVYVTPNY